MRHLPPFVLPLPDGSLPLLLNIALVEEMEAAAGSLYALAARLIEGRAAHGDLLRLLAAAYRAAGCGMDETALEDYLMTLNVGALCTRLLTAVLTPLVRIDIAAETLHAGECPPAQAGC